MNKLILGIILAISFANAEVDYNKAMEHLGGNCRFVTKNINNDNKIFVCDSGFIGFNFINREIVISFETTSDEGHKAKIHLLFNRDWDENGEQYHKEKYTIFVVEDEFGTIVNTGTGKWSGNGGEFYDRFKKNIYYRKQMSNNKKIEQTNKTTNEQELSDREDCPPSWKVKGKCLKSYFEYEPDGGWYCDINDCD